MRYTFFLYSDESVGANMTEADMEQDLAAFGAYIGALQEAGVFVHTDWLQPPATATTVSTSNGEAVVHDGPFAETKEQLGGFFVIEAPSLDVALEWAQKCPAVQYGKVEVRASAMGG